MATYAIGDIQGCMASLERLLSLIAFSDTRDRLWLVGDLVNRGPRSLDVLRWAMSMGDAVTCVLGNHDLHLLARAAGAEGEKKRDTLDEVLRAREADRLIDWLRTKPFVHEGKVGGTSYAMVHGGLHPHWTIPEAKSISGELERELQAPTWRAFLAQTSGGKGKPPRWDAKLGGGDRWRAALAYLVRARMLKPDGRVEPDFDGAPKDGPAGAVPWFAFPSPAWTTHTIVFGHWAALGLSLGPHHAGLDTGCVWGNALTALRLDDRAAYQIKAVEPPS